MLRFLPVADRALSDAPNPRSRWRRAGLAAAGVVQVGVVVAVFAGGVTPKGTQPPVLFPILSPENCSSCHGDFDAANNVEPFPTWAGSMMANASRDPLFWAALDVANHDVPGVGDFCLRCHLPTGWLDGRSEPPAGSVDGCAMVGNIDDSDNDFSGVSCHLCHRMMENESPPPGEQGLYFENGQYWIDDENCPTGSGPCRRGPYDFGAGVPTPPHAWAFSPYHQDAGMCGNCHNVTSPTESLIDAAGTDTGIPFPVERTYREWQQSDFAIDGAGRRDCQSCHMPDATEDPVFACLFQEINRTGDLPVHRFVGGNTWVPEILKGEYPNLGRADNFDATIAWAEDMLRNQAASLALTAPATVSTSGPLGVSVRVTNLSGHKLPTGYAEGRRMWLGLKVTDATDTVVFESAAYDDATGTLTVDEQAKVYERAAGIWNLNGTGACDVTDAGGDHIFHFVRSNCIAKDNRIPPAGFTGGADPETQPVGHVYPETSPGSGVLVNFDDTIYSVPLPAGVASPLTVEARLLFQTTSKEYVTFLRDQAVDNSFPDDCITRSSGVPAGQSRGELMFDLWQAYGRSAPVEMLIDSAVVAIPDAIFADGFEVGGTSAWSVTVP